MICPVPYIMANGVIKAEPFKTYYRDVRNLETFTFELDGSSTYNHFRAALVIQNFRDGPSLYLIGTDENTCTIHKVYCPSNGPALKAATINGNTLTITYQWPAYGGCTVLWLD